VKGQLYRQHRRTVKDVYDNATSGRLERQLETIQVKIQGHCREHHRWQIRTGALQESIGYEKPVRTPEGVTGVVYAGGPSRVKYSYDYARRKSSGKRRRMSRLVDGRRTRVRRGGLVWVNYAQHVENKGYPVLKQGIRHYKRQITRMFRDACKIRRLGPRGGKGARII